MPLTKLLSLFLCFCLILEQPVFAQTIDLSHYFVHNSNQNIPRGDKFRPLHLRYISYDNQANDFKILLDKGDFFNQKTKKTLELEQTTQELMKYFFVGLALPNEKFWVNLRPDSPDNILDPDLEKTDIGRIFLEADLQLKKDTSGMTSPQTKEGREYWDKLYKKAGELFGTENITIPTITRPWIVPNEIIIREAPDNAYIYKATLKVMLEEDYLDQKTEKPKNGKTEELKNQRTDWHSFSDPRLKELNEYSTELIRETIIPKLIYAVNTAKRYAPLRQVYYSLILAQWFKQKYGSPGSIRAPGTRAPVNSYIDLIDSGNLVNLASREPYDKQMYFQQYQKSFKNGEYNLQEPVYTPMGQSIRRYTSGGLMVSSAIEKAITILAKKGPDNLYNNNLEYDFRTEQSSNSMPGERGKQEGKQMPAFGGTGMEVINFTITLDDDGILEAICNIAKKWRLTIAFSGGTARAMLLGKNPINGSDVDIMIINSLSYAPSRKRAIESFLQEIEKYGLAIDLMNVDMGQPYYEDDSDFWIEPPYYNVRKLGALTVDRLLVWFSNGQWRVSSEAEERGAYKDNFPEEIKNLYLQDAKRGNLRLTPDGEISPDTILRLIRVIAEFPQAPIDLKLWNIIQNFNIKPEAVDLDLVRYIINLINTANDKRSREYYYEVLSYVLKNVLRIFIKADNPRDAIKILEDSGNMVATLGAVLSLEDIAETVIQLNREKKGEPLSCKTVIERYILNNNSCLSYSSNAYIKRSIIKLSWLDLLNLNRFSGLNRGGLYDMYIDIKMISLGGVYHLLLESIGLFKDKATVSINIPIGGDKEMANKIFDAVTSKNYESNNIWREIIINNNYESVEGMVKQFSVSSVVEVQELSVFDPRRFPDFVSPDFPNANTEILRRNVNGVITSIDPRGIVLVHVHKSFPHDGILYPASYYGNRTLMMKNPREIIEFSWNGSIDYDYINWKDGNIVVLVPLKNTPTDNFLNLWYAATSYFGTFSIPLGSLVLVREGVNLSEGVIKHFLERKIGIIYFPKKQGANEAVKAVLSKSGYVSMTMESSNPWETGDTVTWKDVRNDRDYGSYGYVIKENRFLQLGNLIQGLAEKLNVPFNPFLSGGAISYDLGRITLSMENIYRQLEEKGVFEYWDNDLRSFNIISDKAYNTLSEDQKQSDAGRRFLALTKLYSKFVELNKMLNSSVKDPAYFVLSLLQSQNEILKQEKIRESVSRINVTYNVVPTLFPEDLQNLNDFLRIVKLLTEKDSPGILDVLASEESNVSAKLVLPSVVLQSREERKTSASPVGGIAFNSLPIQTESVASSALGVLSGSRAFSGDLDAEWGRIQDVFNAGIRPSIQRLSEYAAAAVASPLAEGKIDQIRVMLADILRRDEESEKLAPAEESCKQLLMALEWNVTIPT